MDVDGLLADYSVDLGDSLTNGLSTYLYMSLIGSVALIVILIGWYIFKNMKLNQQRRDDDKKLQDYFELYSDVIADKVIKKLNDQNIK